uniref:uroporphyrinogen-III C-methyltransferase n=1 Tax=uncultured bacterium 888 TaxID=548896 RepID=B8R8P0_9BACT|nr:putative uroporphyrin-III C-methyltransferase NirE [uncultured bacterium 888]
MREGGRIHTDSLIPLARAETSWLRKFEAVARKQAEVLRIALTGKRADPSATDPLQRRAGEGEVALVGCGPGDPELLTLRALRVLREAQVIVYDHLVSNAILELARPGARRIYVGKESGRHTLPQERINALMIALANEGLRVARLKGGDPFVFGRGGEELQALARSGVDVRVVPGITAACGVAASTGVPLTHRDHAHSCIFVTGHLHDGTMDLDWEGLARPSQTIVVYMGLKGLPILSRELIRHGLPAATPAMIVSQGTLSSQRVVTGTIETLPRRAAAEKLEPPTMIVIGEVVSVRTALKEHAEAGRASSAARSDPTAGREPREASSAVA